MTDSTIPPVTEQDDDDEDDPFYGRPADLMPLWTVTTMAVGERYRLAGNTLEDFVMLMTTDVELIAHSIWSSVTE